MNPNTRRRIEKLQSTMFKLIGQLESCKLLLDEIKEMRKE